MDNAPIELIITHIGDMPSVVALPAEALDEIGTCDRCGCVLTWYMDVKTWGKYAVCEACDQALREWVFEKEQQETA